MIKIIIAIIVLGSITLAIFLGCTEEQATTETEQLTQKIDNR